MMVVAAVEGVDPRAAAGVAVGAVVGAGRSMFGAEVARRGRSWLGCTRIASVRGHVSIAVAAAAAAAVVGKVVERSCLGRRKKVVVGGIVATCIAAAVVQGC